MTENKEKSNFWTTLPGILTGLAAVIGAVGTIYLGTHTSDGAQNSKIPSKQESPSKIPSKQKSPSKIPSKQKSPSAQPIEPIVGTYKWNKWLNNQAYSQTIDFHRDGSAIQDNGDKGTWKKEPDGTYTLNFDSKWRVVGLNLTQNGSKIKGNEIAPDGKIFRVEGEKQ